MSEATFASWKAIGRCFQAVIMFWMNYMHQPTSVLQLFTACDQNLC